MKPYSLSSTAIQCVLCLKKKQADLTRTKISIADSLIKRLLLKSKLRTCRYRYITRTNKFMPRRAYALLNMHSDFSNNTHRHKAACIAPPPFRVPSAIHTVIALTAQHHDLDEHWNRLSQTRHSAELGHHRIQFAFFFPANALTS